MKPEDLKSWRESGRELFAASAMTPDTINPEERTVDVIWYSGADVLRVDWWSGELFTRKFDPAGADLSLLNNGAPVLDDHNSYNGCEGQQGVVDRAWIDAPNYKGTLRFSKTPDVDNLWNKIASRIVSKFSMGVMILEDSELRDQQGKLISKTAMKWQPFEISCTPIPADFGTTTLSGQRPLTGRPAANLIHEFRRREAEILRLR